MWKLREFWLPLAQGLPVGTSTRVAHPYEPNSRASVVIRHSTTGYSAWDFRNREGDWVDKEIVFTLIEEEALNSLEQPEDLIPLDELEEFYRAYITSYLFSKGVTPDMFKRARKPLYFSPDTGRLLFTCKADNGSELTEYLIGRDMTGRSQAKYLSYRTKPYQTHDIVQGAGDTVVLTEDSLSATKIFYATGLTAVALSGTMLRSEVLYICSKFNRVILWLDGDEAGITGERDALRELKGVVSEVRCINVWDKDPKDLQIQQIQNLIREV